MAFWLDANTFITAKNSLYAFEVNTSFWAWLDSQLVAKTVKSPQRVFQEIMQFRKDDPLKSWVHARRASGLCVEPDKNTSICLRRIADHLYTATTLHPKTHKQQSRYKQAQVSHFFPKCGCIL